MRLISTHPSCPDRRSSRAPVNVCHLEDRQQHPVMVPPPAAWWPVPFSDSVVSPGRVFHSETIRSFMPVRRLEIRINSQQTIKHSPLK